MFVIRETHFFFHGGDRRSLVQAEDGRSALTFDTWAAARKWVAKAVAETYVLMHNEHSRPAYLVLDADKLPAYLAEQL